MQSEETKNAAWSGPMGIVVSVPLSSVFGWIYLVSLTSIVTDIPFLLDPSNDAGGNAVAQALYSVFRSRFGSGAGGIACLAAMAVAIFLCGTASVTSNSRMGYAFSRDGAMPFSRVWYRVNKQEVPFNVVWLSVSVAFVMALTVRVDLISIVSLSIWNYIYALLSYDPNSVSQENGRLLTERSGGPSPVGLGHKYPLGFSIRD
jgi:amino acid transporter